MLCLIPLEEGGGGELHFINAPDTLIRGVKITGGEVVSKKVTESGEKKRREKEVKGRKIRTRAREQEKDQTEFFRSLGFPNQPGLQT